MILPGEIRRLRYAPFGTWRTKLIRLKPGQSLTLRTKGEQSTALNTARRWCIPVMTLKLNGHYMLWRLKTFVQHNTGKPKLTPEKRAIIKAALNKDL